jgi:hypothetical protein
MSARVNSTASETVAAAPARPQTRGMDAQQRATIREAAGRHPVNAFRLHHFAGLGCYSNFPGHDAPYPCETRW